MGRKLVEERSREPFASIADLAARIPLRRDELAALAEIGALTSVPARAGGKPGTRRAALWQVEAAVRRGTGLFARVEPREENDIDIDIENDQDQDQDLIHDRDPDPD